MFKRLLSMISSWFSPTSPRKRRDTTQITKQMVEFTQAKFAVRQLNGGHINSGFYCATRKDFAAYINLMCEMDKSMSVIDRMIVADDTYISKLPNGKAIIDPIDLLD